MRISIVQDTVFDAHLTHNLRHAELIRSPTFQSAVERFLAEGLDAVAGLKEQMTAFVQANAGLRVMEGRFMAIEPAFAVPKGHSAGLRYLTTFVEELKASRRLADALQWTSTAASH
jgi:polar amino acid transport system substrate-binding protein